MVEWTPGKSVAATIASTPTGQLCKAAFDPYEELLWVGNHDGRLNSFLLSSRELDINEELEIPYGKPLNRHWELDVYRYTSFRAHDTAIKEIICHDAGIMTLDTMGVKWTTRSGASTLVRLQDGPDCFAFSSSSTMNNRYPFKGLECAASLFPSMHDVYICGNPGNMVSSCVIHILNMAKGLIVKQVPLSLYDSATPFSIVKMKRTPRTMFCACDNGQVLIVDTRSFRVEQVLGTHSSTLVDLDFSWGQPLLATCGYNVRQESWGAMLLPEPWIRMFDIRMMRALPPISFSAGAHRVQFHPKLTSVMMGIGMHGETLQVCDNLGLSSAGSFRYLPAPIMSNCVALEVASSGQLLAVVDTVGVVHLLEETSREGRDFLRVNDHSRPTEMATHGIVAPDVFIGIDDYETPLSSVGMPYYEEPLLSGIWPSLKFKVGRPTSPIDPILLATMKWRNNIGYAPNPRKTRRNQAVLSTESKDLEPMFRSVKEKRQKWDTARTDSNLDSGKTIVDTTSPILFANTDDSQIKLTMDEGLMGTVWTDLPMAYRRVEIKYSKFGVEDFDFAFYNKTEFGGLESHITNSYCNALLQVFYFQPSLRSSMLSHMSISPEMCLNRVCLACELGFLFRMLDQSQGMNCQATNFLRVFSMIPQATALGLSEPDIPTSETPYAFLIQNFNRFILEQLHKETSPDNSGTDGKPTIISPIEDLYAISVKVINRCKCGAETLRTSQLFAVDLIYPKKSVSSITIEDTAAIDSFSKLLIASLARKTNLRAWCDICKAYEPTSQSRQMNPSFPNILNINCGPVNQEYFDLWLRKEMHTSDIQQHHPHSSLLRPHKSWFPLSLSIQVSDKGQIEIEDLSEKRSDLPNSSSSSLSEGAIYDLIAYIAEIRKDKGRGHLVAHIKGKFLEFN